MSVRSLGKGAGHLGRLEAWTTALEADIYKVRQLIRSFMTCP